MAAAPVHYPTYRVYVSENAPPGSIPYFPPVGYAVAASAAPPPDPTTHTEDGWYEASLIEKLQLAQVQLAQVQLTSGLEREDRLTEETNELLQQRISRLSEMGDLEAHLDPTQVESERKKAEPLRLKIRQLKEEQRAVQRQISLSLNRVEHIGNELRVA